MNNLTLPLQQFTPPKKARRTSVFRSKPSSLYLQTKKNPPQIQIDGSLSQRSKHEHSKSLINTPLTSRKKPRSKQLPSIFLVRHKHPYIQTLQTQLKPKRQFDSYLSYIMSPSQKYTPCIKKQQGNKNIAKTLQRIFSKISQNTQDAKQLSILYLSFYEKLQFEQSHSKPFLNKLYVLQRLICYYIVILYGSNKSSLYDDIFKRAAHQFVKYYEALRIIDEQKVVKKGIGSAVRELKLMCEVEKNYDEIFEELKSLSKPLSRQLYEAEKQLILLTNHVSETNFHEKLTKLEFSLNWKLFKLPPIPYLPPSRLPYTILVELDTTLTFYDQTNKLLLFRPYLEQFFKIVKDKYEIVLFTIASKQYADKVIKQIDPFDELFEARLYNQHISINEDEFYKDISKLGRHASKVLILDSDTNVNRIYSQNLIELSKWYGNEFDEQLKNISALLHSAGDKNTEDLRKIDKISKRSLTHISEQNSETLTSFK